MFKKVALFTLAFLTLNAHSFAQEMDIDQNKAYYIESKHKQLVLDIEGGSGNSGAPVILFKKNGGVNQKFKIIKVDDKFVRILACHSALALDVKDANKEDGAPIIQYQPHGHRNQLFTFMPAENGYFFIIAKHSEKVFDVEKGTCKNGARVIQNEIGDRRKTQLFRLVPFKQPHHHDNHDDDDMPDFPTPTK